MERLLIYDAETRSKLNLRQVGSHIYLNDATTDVWCVSFCTVTDGARGAILTWLPPQPVPSEILDLAADPAALIVAFNDVFERQLEQNILGPRYGWPIFPIHRRRCAQAAALSRALPGSLDAVAAALGLGTRKTAAGKAAMKKLALPRKPNIGEPPGLYWHDTPNELATLYEYNRADVEMTAEIVRQIGFISPEEQLVWELDAAINAHGLYLDGALLDAARRIATEASDELVTKLTTLTDGEITSPTQVTRMLEWLKLQDCDCVMPSLQKPVVREALARTDLTPEVRQLLELRLDGAHAAVSKLDTLRRWLAPDSRIRHCYRYHGASTGRFTSHGAQLQNLKKPTVDDVPAAIAAVQTGSLAHLQAHYDRPLEVVGDITRALVTAAPGHQLYIADLSGIESRGLAWLCNETGKLEQWRAFDRSGDPKDEPYYQIGRELGLDESVARSIGKTCDLAFQYQGAVGAWRNLARDDTTPDATIQARRKTWLRRHPNIEKFWRTSIRQAVNTIESAEGERFSVAKIAFQRERDFLYLELPSGRRIAFPFARIYADDFGKTFSFRDASGGRWEWYHVLKRRGAFGGLVAENATQGLCRDLFVAAMLRLERAGYHLIGHLHDEVVVEAPIGFGSLAEFIELITTPPDWAPDFPLAAKGRIAERFIELKQPKPAEAAIDNARLDDDGAPLDLAPGGPADHEPAAAEFTIGAAPHIEESVPPPPNPPPPGPPPPNPPPPDDPPPDEEPDPHRGNGSSGNGRDPDGFGGNGPAGDAYMRGEEPRGAPIAKYVYKDARGLLYMRVIRTDAKSFPTQHWADGRWVSGWPQTVIPYRLPELLAVPAARPVWICEGEKDADNVAALGLVATTNPGGAGKWQPELAPWFASKQLIYLLEDNDAAGRDHTAKIITALRPIVPTIAVVSFPELQEGGDVSDWLEAGGNRQLLEARAEQVGRRQQRRYLSVNLAKVEACATEWIWPDHLVRGGLELLAGTPEIGKSQIHCQYIACATTERSWPNGAPGIVPVRVILLTAEDNTADTIVPRLKAARANLALVEQLNAIRRNSRDELFLLAEDLGVLEEMIRDFGDVGLVTIDPITAFMGHGKHFDSHRATDVRSQLSPLKALAERTQVAFSAITHPPKNASPRALDHFIGSQSYIAAARVGHLAIAEMEDGPHGAKRATGRRFFTTAKMNVEARPPTLGYRIGVVEVGTDPKTGKTIRAPVIEWEADPIDITPEEALAQAKPTKPGNQGAQDFLREILASGPVLATVVIERGAERGFTYDQLRRVREKLGVVAFREASNTGTGRWRWALPQHAPDVGGPG
jgi:DNA polymerase